MTEWEGIVALVDELSEGQKDKILRCGRRIVPTLTPEDVLQPNDYPELEAHADFRYEEGVLEGLLTARMALLRLSREDK